MNKQKPTFERMCDPAYRRAELVTEKMGAVFVIFNELNGLINKTQLARQYMNHSQSWLAQKINGCVVCNKTAAFTDEEYHQLADAFRAIAARLIGYADEIDAAGDDGDDDEREE